MISISKSFGIVLLTLAASTSSNAAFGAEQSRETCTSQAYTCQSWGYTGTDSYGYYNWSNKNALGLRHNCTSYAAFMLDFVTPHDTRWSGLGDAAFWATRAKGYGLAVSSTPHTYDIAQWNSGHVAFVESVSRDSTGKVLSITVTDDNYYRLMTTTKVIYAGPTTNNISYPDNFITFPRINGGGGGKGPLVLSTPLQASQE